MGSLFSNEIPKREPTVLERIGPEITHLKNKTSVRTGSSVRRSAPWTLTIIVGSLFWLYLMDPFLYALHKSDAIRTYLYLHNYDSPAATQPLVATKIFSIDEIRTLDAEHGSYQDYFASPAEARQKAASIVSYLQDLQYLHEGNEEKLDFVGKFRCVLFVKTGLTPPIHWSILDPSIN